MVTAKLQWAVDIPAEIRLMVYEIYFESLAIHIHSPTCSDKYGDCKNREISLRWPGYKYRKHRSRPVSTDSALALFLVCKLIHAESEHLLFKRARFMPSACFKTTLQSTRSSPLTFSNIAQTNLQKVALFRTLLSKRQG